MAVVYLIFNEGYAASAASSLREDLCAEAMVCAACGVTRPRRPGDHWSSRAHADRIPADGAGDAGRRSRPTRRAGSQLVEPAADRGRAGPGAALPPLESAGTVSDSSGDQRRTATPRRQRTGSRSCSSMAHSWPFAPSPVVALNRAVAVGNWRPRSRRSSRTCARSLLPVARDPGRFVETPGRYQEAALAYDTAITRTEQSGRTGLPSARPRRGQDALTSATPAIVLRSTISCPGSWRTLLQRNPAGLDVLVFVLVHLVVTGSRWGEEEVHLLAAVALGSGRTTPSGSRRSATMPISSWHRTRPPHGRPRRVFVWPA